MSERPSIHQSQERGLVGFTLLGAWLSGGVAFQRSPGTGRSGDPVGELLPSLLAQGAGLAVDICPMTSYPASGDVFDTVEPVHTNSPTTGSGMPKRTIIGFSVLLVLALTAGTTILVGASTTRSVATNAQLLHAANSTAGAASLTRVSIAQAIVFAVDADFGVATQADAAIAIAEARLNLDYLRLLHETAPLTSRSGSLATSNVITAGENVLIALELGTSGAAEAVRQQEFEPAFVVAVEAATAQQDTASASITATEDTAAKIAVVAQVVVTLLIPSLAMGLYWIVARRRMKERKRDMQTQLAHEEALINVRAELISGLSLKLKTPLATIQGFADILQAEGRSAFVEEDLALLIGDEADELENMVEDLIVATRMGSSSISCEAVDLRRVVFSVAEQSNAKGHPIGLEGEFGEVMADAPTLRHVLRNLVSNAQQHDGLNITIETSTGGESVEIAVRDNGSGVSAAEVHTLFQNGSADIAPAPGSRARGLGVSHDMVRQMGGTLTYARSGDWNNFIVELPRSTVVVS